MNAKIIYKDGRQSYGLSIFEPQNALLLAMFLTDDVGSSGKNFIKWFENPDNDLGSSNATQYLVDEGIVTLTPEWRIDFDECIAQGNYFEMTLDQMIQLLHLWEMIHKQRPLYITITINDNQVDVTGSNISL